MTDFDKSNGLRDSMRRGVEDAFMDIYHNNYDMLYSYGFKISKSRELTQDCIHEIFMDLWKRREGLADILNTKGYLLKSLRTMIVKKIVKEKRVIGVASINMEVDLEISQEDLIIRDELNIEKSQILIKAINKLSKRQKEVIYLRFFDNLDFETISEITSLKYQSVRNLLHKALLSLRRSISCLLLIMAEFMLSA